MFKFISNLGSAMVATLMLVLLFAVTALAQVALPEAPKPDDYAAIFAALVDVITNAKVYGTLGTSIVSINIIVALLGSGFAKNWFKEANRWIQTGVIVALGQLSGVLTLVFTGYSWQDAVVQGLLVSGGAVAIWELLLKPLFKKDK